MKKVFFAVFLSVFLLGAVSGEYNPDKSVSSDWPSTKMTTTSSESPSMHPSWDLDFDGINDCENLGTCDHTIDYTSAKTYDSKIRFLEAEWGICKSATDWCNTIGVYNWEFTFGTEMWCEDVYGEWGQEVYSCNAYDQTKMDAHKYIYNNISDLTEEEPVLGGSWYVTDIDWQDDDNIVVSYEDGHIVGQVSISQKDIDQTVDTNDKEDHSQKICTMEYAPVCAEVQVQCITAPCYPVQQTFSNACMAGDNPILYTGQCNSFVDIMVYKRYQQFENKLGKSLSNVPTDVLTRAVDRVDTMIDDYLSTKKEISLIKKRVTQLVFVKELIKKELSFR